MDILSEIVLRTQERVNSKKGVVSAEEMMKTAERLDIDYAFPFENALCAGDISFICEIKRASPSKGLLADDFPYLQIAKEYEATGAAAISVLTEPFYFQGADRYLSEVAEVVSLPLLRKDFVIDAYMIFEAKVLKANAILLICAILDGYRLAEYIQIAHGLGLSVLVETHTESEVEIALNAGARVIGANNRNLKTFEVDISASERLRPLVPKDKIFVSESGVQTPADINRLRKIGANAALIGETLMRSPDRLAELKRLRG